MNTREIALDTLLALEQEGDYSHRLVKAVLDKHNYLEARDKAFIKRLTEGTLERRLELDYYLDQYSSVPVKKMKPLIRCVLRMSVYQLLYMDSVPDSAVCNEACKMTAKRGFQNLKGFVNGVLRTISKKKDMLLLPDSGKEPVKYLSVKYSMPEWLVELWLGEYGTEITVTILKGLLEVRPVSLRFSTLISAEEREKICGLLRGKGVRMTKSPYLPYIFLMEHAEGVAALPGFREGMFIVQDVSSALAVEAAGIGEEDFVVDVCCAPGGKCILAAEKAKKGRVIARDVSEEKTALTAENIHRMGMENIEVQMFDGTDTDEELLGKADVVLLDVPCSGLGVIGKKRDIKYRVTAGGIKELEGLQRQIIRASAGYVKPGGTLLYSTCTIQSGENEAMVRFIVRELGFEPVSLEGILPESVLAGKRKLEEQMGKVQAGAGVSLDREERNACMQFLPGFTETDGFFLARFRRPE